MTTEVLLDSTAELLITPPDGAELEITPVGNSVKVHATFPNPPDPPPPDPDGDNLLLNGFLADDNGDASFTHWVHENPAQPYFHDPSSGQSGGGLHGALVPEAYPPGALPEGTAEWSPTGTIYLQCDYDDNGSAQAWPSIGDPEAACYTLSKPVVPGSYGNVLMFTVEEAHHIDQSEALVELYGRNDNDGEWELIYTREGMRSPRGTGKPKIGPPIFYEDEGITLPHTNYNQFKVRVWGRLKSGTNGGWLLGAFGLYLT